MKWKMIKESLIGADDYEVTFEDEHQNKFTVLGLFETNPRKKTATVFIKKKISNERPKIINGRVP